MADLGNIGRQYGASTILQKRRMVSRAVYRRPTNADLNELAVDVTGSISGRVTIGSVPTQGVHVGLFYRDSFNLIARATTSNTGDYTFDGLDRSDLGAYFVTVLDPQASPEFNYSLTRDHLSAG